VFLINGERHVAKVLSTLSPKTATVVENGETTATVAEFGDSRTFLRQSPFSATVAVFGDKLSPKSATIRQCGQAFTGTNMTLIIKLIYSLIVCFLIL